MDDIDEDEYWGASKVQKSIKKKDIFSDCVTIDDASSMAKFQHGLDIEEVGWDDKPVKRPEMAGSLSKESRPALVNDPVLSSSQVYKTHNRSRSDVQISKPQLMVQSPSLSSFKPGVGMDVSIASLADSRPRPKTARSEEDQQLQYLQDRLKKAEDSMGVSRLKPVETIKRMIMGQSFSLEQYKSKVEKLELLDRAIKTYDGNAIIAVVIFLKRTLSEQIFYYELTRRQDAVDQYLSYLKAHFNTRELEHMLEKLNRSEEIAMLRYKQASGIENPETKINRLGQCLHAHFEHNPSLEHNASLIRQQISLLQRQRPVDVGDDMLEKQGKHIIFRSLPRTCAIINMPVITTLFYCCIYHYEEPDNLLSSPLSIKNDHQLTEKQYIWTALRARAKLKKWTDIDGLFTTKGWLGGTKMKSVIGFDKVSAVLHRFEAPSSVLCKYLLLVDDIDKRLEIARKMTCSKAIIETYVAQRDKKSLELYKSKLKPNSEEWFYCADMLNSNVKWKS